MNSKVKSNYLKLNEIEPKYFNYSDADKKYFREVLDKVIKFHSTEISDSKFTEITKLFTELIPNLYLPAIEISSNIIRARCNEKFQVFENEKEISYRTENLDKLGPGRFNKPKESVFYGAVLSGNQANDLLGMFMECKKNLLEELKINGNIFFTIGIFKVIKPFYALNLCFDEKIYQNFDFLEMTLKLHLANLQKNCDNEVFKIMKEWWEYLSKISTDKFDDINTYFKSSALANSLNEVFGDKDYKGIIYPSSAYESRAINLALIPKTVDECLELENVVIYKLQYANENSNNITSYPICRVASAKEGVFKLEDIEWDA